MHVTEYLGTPTNEYAPNGRASRDGCLEVCLSRHRQSSHFLVITLNAFCLSCGVAVSTMETGSGEAFVTAHYAIFTCEAFKGTSVFLGVGSRP